MERKKRRFAVLCILACGALTVLTVAGIRFGPVLSRYVRYESAKGRMERGLYGQAASDFESLGDFEESAALREECLAALEEELLDSQYRNAASLAEQGDYKNAYAAFAALGSYRDAEARGKACLRSLWGDVRYEEWEGMLRWDPYSFGNYRGSTEWVILEKRGTTLLLISRDCLETLPYHSQQQPVTWAESSLRFWLNGAFLNEAFSEQERGMLCLQSVSGAQNPLYSSQTPASTEDLVTVFSDEEVKTYFFTTALRKVKPSDHAVANGIRISDSGCCSWWLRDGGYYRDFACYVSSSGGTVYGGDCVSDAGYGVRPVIRIDLLKQGQK